MAINNLQLRHFDYRLDVGTIAAGTTRRGLVLNFDTDSSFMLRGRTVHVKTSTGQLTGQNALLAFYKDRYTGPDQEYLSQDLTRFRNENAAYGQYGSPLPVRPPVIYPPGGSISIDVANDGGADMTGVELYFRGQKIFQPGVLECLTYPERMSSLPYIYSDSVLGLGVVSNGANLNNVVSIQGDSDFVLRALTIGSQNPVALGGSQYFQVYVQLKDWDGRAYSNLPVHVDACFGACGSMANGGSGGSLAVQVGPYHPPLLMPEIYIPRSRVLYYDITRDDAFVGGAAAVDLRLAFMGSKVYPQ